MFDMTGALTEVERLEVELSKVTAAAADLSLRIAELRVQIEMYRSYRRRVSDALPGTGA